jgi:hypothetical protein
MIWSDISGTSAAFECSWVPEIKNLESGMRSLSGHMWPSISGKLNLDRSMNESTVTYSQMFSDRRLLIVEDEHFLDEEASRKLRELGAIVIGPISDIGHALELIEAKDVDAAILDVHLGAELVFPIVEKLEGLELPYVFAVGRGPPFVPVGFTGFILCERAVEIEYIAKALFGSMRRTV